MALAVEDVWDYPRPPRLEPVREELRVTFASVEIARTSRGWRVLETSHAPTYYIPPDDVAAGVLEAASGASVCEWKGNAQYWSVVVGDRRAVRAAWSYPEPTDRFAPLRDHLAFYVGLMDQCSIDGVAAVAQPGDFYGGWVTPNLRGAIKGAPGTWGW